MAANGQQARKETENAKCEAEIAAQTVEQLSALVRTVLKSAFTATAFRDLHDEMELQKANGANVADPTMYGSHANRDSSRDSTIFMSDLEKADIIVAVQKAVLWTFCGDGSSDSSLEHCVAVLVMWIDESGQTWCALWDILDCDGDAMSQFAMLREEFVMLDWKKLVGGSLDGASVNFGKS